MSQAAVVQFFNLIFNNMNVRLEFNKSLLASAPEKMRSIGKKNGFTFPQEITLVDESVVRFLNNATQNQEIQIEINSSFVSEAPEIVAEIAQNQGCDFTADELKSVADKEKQHDYELSERELDAVAGGAMFVLAFSERG